MRMTQKQNKYTFIEQSTDIDELDPCFPHMGICVTLTTKLHLGENSITDRHVMHNHAKRKIQEREVHVSITLL